jgi:nucleoside-diphosphate-sugar epimerase
MGADVTVLVKYKSIIDNVRLSSIWNNIHVKEVDLRNLDSLSPLKNQRFDIVFHLAAYNHVGDSFLHVNESLMSNAIATANLLESGIEYGRFIYTATSEVYGFQEKVPFSENFQPFPISPYAIGKYAGELYARMKRHQADMPIVVIRPFNTFGPYQSDRAVIPELIIKCLRGIPVETTEGLQTREFNYIENIIKGFLSIAQVEPIPDGVINVGSGEEISISDLVRKIHKLFVILNQNRIVYEFF